MINPRVPVTLTELKRMPARAPARSTEPGWYHAHAALVGELLARAEAAGLGVDHLTLGLSRDGQGLACSVTLAPPRVRAPRGARPALGVVAANDWRRATRCYVGYRTDGGLGLPLLSPRALRHAPSRGPAEVARWMLDHFTRLGPRLAGEGRRLAGAVLQYDTVLQLLNAANRAGLLPYSRNRVVEETLVRKGRLTSWALLKGFAAAARKGPVMEQMKNVYGFAKMLPAKET